jgi:hypothetical protein
MEHENRPRLLPRLPPGCLSRHRRRGHCPRRGRGEALVPTSTRAILTGEINARGQRTRFKFQYGLTLPYVHTSEVGEREVGSANRSVKPKIAARAEGAYRNRTGVNGFAGRCVATPPRRRKSLLKPIRESVHWVAILQIGAGAIWCLFGGRKPCPGECSVVLGQICAGQLRPSLHGTAVNVERETDVLEGLRLATL